MPDKNVNVTVTQVVVDPGGTQYNWSVDNDPVDMGHGQKSLEFKQAGSTQSEWTFTAISIWRNGETEPAKGTTVAPFSATVASNGKKIDVTDDDTTAADAGTFKYRLWGAWGTTAINHDPQIINRGGA